MNATNKIIRVSSEKGYEPCVKEYPIVFSALEALTKFACERLGLDYNKAKEVELGQKVEDARKLRLSDFSPRELMEELARRGYKGKLTFVEVHTIDIQNF